MNNADDAIWNEIHGFLSGDKDRRGTAAILVQHYLHLDDMKDVELSPHVLQPCFAICMEAVQKEDDPDTKTDLLQTLAHIVSSLGIRNVEVDLSPLVEALPSYNDEQLPQAITAMSYTGNLAFLPIISSYLTHENPEVRQAAEDGQKTLLSHNQKQHSYREGH